MKNSLQDAPLMDCSFKDALACFPSGVAIVTTDHDGSWRGFTASSFCSLSAEPALVLACLALNATCHPAFATTTRYVANVLADHHGSLAQRFATKGASKFEPEQFESDPFGPVLSDSVAVIRCTVHARLDGGDHMILVGRVHSTQCRAANPLLYHHKALQGVPLTSEATGKAGVA